MASASAQRSDGGTTVSSGAHTRPVEVRYPMGHWDGRVASSRTRSRNSLSRNPRTNAIWPRIERDKRARCAAGHVVHGSYHASGNACRQRTTDNATTSRSRASTMGNATERTGGRARHDAGGGTGATVQRGFTLTVRLDFDHAAGLKKHDQKAPRCHCLRDESHPTKQESVGTRPAFAQTTRPLLGRSCLRKARAAGTCQRARARRRAGRRAGLRARDQCEPPTPFSCDGPECAKLGRVPDPLDPATA